MERRLKSWSAAVENDRPRWERREREGKLARPGLTGKPRGDGWSAGGLMVVRLECLSHHYRHVGKLATQCEWQAVEGGRHSLVAAAEARLDFVCAQSPDKATNVLRIFGTLLGSSRCLKGGVS
jgi:hypothetical protein